MKIIAACVVVLTLIVLLREAQHQADRRAIIEQHQQVLDSWRGDESDSSDQLSQHGDW